MIDLDKDIELYKSKVAFYESQNTRGEYAVTVRELKFVVETLEALRSERSQGDLISREALKKAFEKVYPLATNEMGGVVNKQIYELIDNAQAVETYTSEDIVKYVSATEDLVRKKLERPKGKWELHGMIYYCSECGHDCGESGDNFCGNCGADMREAITE